MDNMNGADFMIYGLQANYSFGGQTNKVISRRNHLGFAAGMEYNMFRFGGRIPLRLGYSMNPSGGVGFEERNMLTFGFGYRPNNSKFGVDVNFGRSSGGGPTDMSIGISYAVGASK
jgi:hypothetical protein